MNIQAKSILLMSCVAMSNETTPENLQAKCFTYSHVFFQLSSKSSKTFNNT